MIFFPSTAFSILFTGMVNSITIQLILSVLPFFLQPTLFVLQLGTNFIIFLICDQNFLFFQFLDTTVNISSLNTIFFLFLLICNQFHPFYQFVSNTILSLVCVWHNPLSSLCPSLSFLEYVPFFYFISSAITFLLCDQHYELPGLQNNLCPTLMSSLPLDM